MLFYELFLFSADLFILGKIRRTGRRTQFAPTGMSFIYAYVGETCGRPHYTPYGIMFFMNTLHHPNCIAVPVEMRAQKNLARKFFRFYYSIFLLFFQYSPPTKIKKPTTFGSQARGQATSALVDIRHRELLSALGSRHILFFLLLRIPPYKRKRSIYDRVLSNGEVRKKTVPKRYCPFFVSTTKSRFSGDFRECVGR